MWKPLNTNSESQTFTIHVATLLKKNAWLDRVRTPLWFARVWCLQSSPWPPRWTTGHSRCRSQAAFPLCNRCWFMWCGIQPLGKRQCRIISRFPMFPSEFFWVESHWLRLAESSREKNRTNKTFVLSFPDSRPQSCLCYCLYFCGRILLRDVCH